MHIASIGIDLGKTTFHLVALGERNKVLVRKKFSRAQLLTHTAKIPSALIGIEACAGSHFLGTRLREQGHEVRLIPAQFVKPQRSTADDPASFLKGMNAALCGNTQSQFVTAAYVHLNAQLEELRYSAAGHPPMLLLRNGAITRVEENGLMLAAFDFASYANAVHKLESGDRILLYTDGIVEAANASGDFFGQDSLGDLLKSTAKLSSSSAADSIMTSVRRWSARQDDDLTVLVCDYVNR